MIKEAVKRVYLVIGLFWIMGILPCSAQTFVAGTRPDPAVLVSKSPIPRFNLEISLVDIKVVDAPVLRAKNDTMAMGSEERYGQGIIIDSTGIIATNRHIIGNAQHIYVVL